MPDDTQPIWARYHAGIRRRGIAEVELVDSQMVADGVTPNTILVLDFKHFGTVENDVRRIADQLSEKYSVNLLLSDDGQTWIADGTTRSYGFDGMVGEPLHNWVAFRCDVAKS